MQLAVSDVAPYFAAPTRSANSCQVSYITSAGRTTRGNTTMSLWTGMLKSISVLPIAVVVLLVISLLRSRQPAVEVQRLSRDERRGRRRQVHHRGGDVACFSNAAKGDACQDALEECGVLQEPLALRRAHECRRHHVDGDAIGRPLGRELLAEDGQPALRGAVGRKPSIPQCEQASNRADVDLAPA